MTADIWFAKLGYIKENDCSDLANDEFRAYINKDAHYEIFIDYDCINSFDTITGQSCGLTIEEQYGVTLVLIEMGVFEGQIALNEKFNS